MKKILFLVSLQLRNKIKDYFFMVILVSSAIFALLLLISSKIFIGEKYKVFIDSGIFFINFIGLITTLVLSSNFLPDLKKKNFIKWLISLSLDKKHIFCGSFITFSILIFFVIILYFVIFLLFFPVFKIKITLSFFQYFILIILKFLLLGGVCLLISIKYDFFTTLLSGAGIYFIGSSILNFVQYLTVNGKYSMLYGAKMLYFIFPDFSIPHLTAQISHFKNLNEMIFLKSLFYYFSYIAIVLIIGALWIEKKDIT